MIKSWILNFRKIKITKKVAKLLWSNFLSILELWFYKTYSILKEIEKLFVWEYLAFPQEIECAKYKFFETKNYHIFYHKLIWSKIKASNFHYMSKTLWLIGFTIIYRLKGLKPKNMGHTNFYESCDLTKKYI